MGASLLIFANKTDIAGCMEEDEIRVVSFAWVISGTA